MEPVDNDPNHTGQETTEGEDWDSEPEDGDCNQNTGNSDPVNLGTGAAFLEHVDLQPVRLPGETFSAALAFGRYQSSANSYIYTFFSVGPGGSSGYSVSYGDGWTHNYNIQLLNLFGEILITDWQGSRHSFAVTNGVYQGDGSSTLAFADGNYVWQLAHGTRHVFDGWNARHLLSNITDRVGNSVSLSYNSTNLLTTAVDNAGRQLTFLYNSSNALTSVVDPIGRTNSYTYDGAGRLNGVSDALGTRAHYAYEDAAVTNGITRYINARGYTNSFAYNSLRQAIAETNALGRVQTYDWVNTNQIVTVTQFDGTSYTIYNDATGAVTARVDSVGTQQYWRDDKHRATNLVDRLGYHTQYLFDTNVSVNGLSGNLLRRIDALARTNGWSYESTFNFPVTYTNAAGRVTLWTYDGKGNVTTNTDAAGQVTTFGYDGAGNQTSATDANQHTVNYGYDQYGNRTNVTDALGHTTGFVYDLVGRRTGRTDPLGRSESFRWDDRDRLTQQVNVAVETNTWIYDGNGNQVSWTDPLGHTRSNSFDALDRLVTTTLPGDSTPFVTYGYDDANNRVGVADALDHQTKFGYDALGRLTGTTNALNKVWSFVVDAEGRRIRVGDPNQHSQGFVYDAVGQLKEWTNAMTQVTTFDYDKLGNLTSVIDPRTNPLDFGYDAVSRLTDVTYAGGSMEQFYHDGVGNVTGIVTRAGQSIALIYDAANRLTQKNYVGTSDSVTYGYDSANQPTGVVAAVSGGTSVLAFAYDSAGRLTNEAQIVGQASSLSVGYEYYADGRRKRLTYPDATYITYEYNAKGWLTAIKDGGTNNIVTYDYDAAGRRTKRTLENSTFTIYDYDDANQLTSIWHQRSSGGTNTISRCQYGYDAAGNRTNMVGTAGSAVRSESYSYDAADQLTGVTYKTRGVTERIVSYFYDAAGNRTNMVEIIGSATNTTSYVANSDNELTSLTTARQGITITGIVEPGAASNKWYNSTATTRGVSAGVSQTNGTFAIPGVPVSDGANALTVTVTDVSGNVATQVVNVTVISGTTTLGYDGNGNQANENDWGFTYDQENRLRTANNGSVTVNYNYDGVGRLIERRTSGSSVTTNRLYYADWQLIAEYDGDGALQRKYVYGSGIDEPLRMTTGGTNSYFHADGLTSVTEITAASGGLIERYSYDAYGAATFYNGSGVVTNGSAIGNCLLFTSRERDPDTGWYNHRHRFCNPSLGRFAQPDPIRAKGGDLNLYRYCSSHPINFKDPSGLCADGGFWKDYWNNLSNDWFMNLSDGARGLLMSPWDLLTGIANGVEGLGTYAGNLSGDPSGTWGATLNAVRNLPASIPPALNQWASDPYAIGSTVGEIGIGLGAAKALSAADKVSSAAQAVEDWLGPGYTKVETKSGSLMFRSADGTKSIRFDLSGSDPHINVETWQPLGNGRFKYTGNVHAPPKP